MCVLELAMVGAIIFVTTAVITAVPYNVQGNVQEHVVAFAKMTVLHSVKAHAKVAALVIVVMVFNKDKDGNKS